MLEVSKVQQDNISIHAPREGCDSYLLHIPLRSQHFNPRTP